MTNYTNRIILVQCANELLTAIESMQESMKVFKQTIKDSNVKANILAASALLVREQQALQDLEAQYALIYGALNSK